MRNASPCVKVSQLAVADLPLPPLSPRCHGLLLQYPRLATATGVAEREVRAYRARTLQQMKDGRAHREAVHRARYMQPAQAKLLQQVQVAGV